MFWQAFTIINIIGTLLIIYTIKRMLDDMWHSIEFVFMILLLVFCDIIMLATNLLLK